MFDIHDENERQAFIERLTAFLNKEGFNDVSIKLTDPVAATYGSGTIAQSAKLDIDMQFRWDKIDK
jgi:hypothetical protein